MKAKIVGVYCIRNIINNKHYIGQSIDIHKRWKDHIYKNNNSVIHRAIQKYGKDAFEFTILRICKQNNNIAHVLMDVYEKHFIAMHRSDDKAYGYNVTSGGSDGYQFNKWNTEQRSRNLLGHSISEETRKKIGDANRGKKHTPEAIEKIRKFSTGRKHTEESKRKIGEGQKNRPIASAETRRKIGEASKRRKTSDYTRKLLSIAGSKRTQPKQRKPVMCKETGVVYESAFSVERILGIHRGGITAVCKKHANTAGGFHWEYANTKVTITSLV